MPRIIALVGGLAVIAIAVTILALATRPEPPPAHSATAAVPEPVETPAAVGRPVAAEPGVAAASARLGGMTATVRVAPDVSDGAVPNQVEAGIERDGQPLEGAAVRYRFVMFFHAMPPDEGIAAPLGGGRYRVPTALRFLMLGAWRLDLWVDGDLLAFGLDVGDDRRIRFTGTS